ncbi:hypothetical protein D918_04144 [Trichuris suis]|nr:hypothetical protein D918_04144 [Trichuris suis]
MPSTVANTWIEDVFLFEVVASSFISAAVISTSGRSPSRVPARTNAGGTVRQSLWNSEVSVKNSH